MRNKNHPPKATFESVWATLQETAQLMKENERERKEYEQRRKEEFAENERRRKEAEQRRKEELAENEQRRKEEFAENEQRRKEEFAENEQRRKEADERSEKEWEKLWNSMKAMQKEVGGIGNSNGKIAESYFVNSFEKSMQFAGQKYDAIEQSRKKMIKNLNLRGEYDLLLYNCTSVVIIEIKYSAEKKHVGWLLKGASVFKQLFPQYANFELYLGLAALHFEENTESEAIDHGIAVIKQVGDNMVINDEHLKVF